MNKDQVEWRVQEKNMCEDAFFTNLFEIKTFRISLNL